MKEKTLNEKKKIVEEFKQKFRASESVVFISYQGINVEQDTKLRRNFREKDVEYKIYKNNLIRIALNDLGITNYDDSFLKGTTSVAFAKDEVAAAKVLFDSKKTMPMLEGKFGVVNGEVIDAEKIKALSKIPSREMLIAMLLGMLNAPVASLARVLDAVAKKQSA